MTKDWDSVRPIIKQLSVDQKKCLQDVKSEMEKKHAFRASTRAYRMKLKEWGYLRHNPRRAKIHNDGKEIVMTMGNDDGSESDGSATMVGSANAIEMAIDPEAQTPSMLPTVGLCESSTNEIVSQMLEAVLDGESHKLEQLIVSNPNDVNSPIGLPFEASVGRFCNHSARQTFVTLEHPNQRILDIASALPNSPVMWVLMAHGAKGSTHPLGTDLALQNAIKNGRAYNVQALLNSGHSNVNGNSTTTWRPLLQAVFWNIPNIVRILLERGADVNGPPHGTPPKAALQMALERRAKDYTNVPVRSRCEEILDMLLNAGAHISVSARECLDGVTPFEALLKPWQTDPTWPVSLSPAASQCLTSFVRKGADLETNFSKFPCSSDRGKTTMHQLLWHSTPDIARIVVDNVPTADGNARDVLHEILGCCPHAKRHPADTLRDIEVLHKRGHDFNTRRTTGETPLTACIQGCPNIDIVPRIRGLLEAGASSDIPDGRARTPVRLASQLLVEPILSQVMDLLVSPNFGGV